MIGFPFDSYVTYDENDNPVFDRGVSSAPYRKLLRELFSTGVMPNPSTNMQVVSSTGMNVKVLPGFAMIDGAMLLEEAERIIAVQASDTQYDRIDTLVLRLNNNDNVRAGDFYVVKGTPSSSPVRPELTREGSIYEIGLADLFITKNSTQIISDKITDTRYESSRCGVISSVSEFDTTALFNQVQAVISNYETLTEAEFEVWFNHMKDQLSEDAAGALQEEIDDINDELDTINDEITDINNGLDTINSALVGYSFRALSEAQYEALSTKNANTFYFIKES